MATLLRNNGRGFVKSNSFVTLALCPVDTVSLSSRIDTLFTPAQTVPGVFIYLSIYLAKSMFTIASFHEGFSDTHRSCFGLQYTWLEEDLASVNRSQTPWVIFSG